MRDRETIDSELRRLAAVRRSTGEHAAELSSRQVDELLDERLGHRTAASGTTVVADAWLPSDKTDDITAYRPKSYRPKSVLRRIGVLAALPLSLVAAATALVVMFAVHNPQPTAPPTAVPPPVVPPLSARPSPTAPKPHIPPLDIVDKAFIDVLKQQGVPIPSHEYVMVHGHAVCDFLAHQTNFTAAVSFVQRSSIWDAKQSTDFAVDAIVSYCPRYETANLDEMQQTFQNAESDLQAIQGDLQGIRDDLQAIQGPR